MEEGPEKRKWVKGVGLHCHKAMVKIKSGMSADSSEGDSEALAAVRDKLKIQQRLIDISARSLLSSRTSSADLSQSFESQSALEVQRENITLLEVRPARL